MELFTNQILAGISTGAIYACMALAVVMIYQAIDHLNFAQGEMAMFSTFISWQLMQWGVPYWGAFVLTLAFSFAGGIAIERVAVQAAGEGADPDQRRGLHRAVLDHQLLRRPDLGLHHQAISDAVRLLAVPRQPADLDPPGRHDRRHLPAAGRALLLLPVHADRACHACRRFAAGIGAAGRHQHQLDDRARLGHGGRDRLDRRHADRAGGVPGAEHDGRRPDLRLRRRRARRPHQPARRRDRRLPGRHLREPRRHLHPRRRQ